MRRRWRAFALAAVALASYGCGSDDAGDLAASTSEGRTVFARAGCGACHTLSDIGSVGTTGPNLDDLQPNAVKVAQTVRNGAGKMPSFRDKLSDEEIEAVAAYVERATGAEPIED